MTTTLYHQDTLISQLRSLVGSENLSDVRMIVGPHRKVFPAHSVLLSVRSPHFHRMLFPEGATQVQKDIELLAADPTSFPNFIEYLYTGRVELTTQNAIHLLYLAKKFDIQELRDACVDIVQGLLNNDNVLEILEVSTMYEESALVQHCLELVDRNAQSILPLPSFADLELKTVLSIVKRESINIDELQLFACCLQWARVRVKKTTHVSPTAKSPSHKSIFFNSTSSSIDSSTYNAGQDILLTIGPEESEAVKREMSHLIPHIRFSLIGSKDLVNSVKPTGCIPEQQYVEALEFNVDPVRFDRNETRFQKRKGRMHQ